MCQGSAVVTRTFTASRTRSTYSVSCASVTSPRYSASLPTITRSMLRSRLAMSMARLISYSLATRSLLIHTPSVTFIPYSCAIRGISPRLSRTE